MAAFLVFKCYVLMYYQPHSVSLKWLHTNRAAVKHRKLTDFALYLLSMSGFLLTV